EQPYQNFEITYSTYLVGDENNLSDLLEEYGVSFYKNPPNQTSTLVWSILSMLIPFALLIIGANIIMRHMSKGGGMMGVGKSKAKAYVQKETGVTFKDVAGEDEAKESLQEVVDFLHNPAKYTAIGAKLPKGAL